MGELTLKDKIIAFFDIKHWVYKITLPLYLWSIGYKSLDDYLGEVERFAIADLLAVLNRWSQDEDIKDKDGETPRFTLDNEMFEKWRLSTKESAGK